MYIVVKSPLWYFYFSFPKHRTLRFLGKWPNLRCSAFWMERYCFSVCPSVPLNEQVIFYHVQMVHLYQSVPGGLYLIPGCIWAIWWKRDTDSIEFYKVKIPASALMVHFKSRQMEAYTNIQLLQLFCSASFPSVLWCWFATCGLSAKVSNNLDENWVLWFSNSMNHWGHQPLGASPE